MPGNTNKSPATLGNAHEKWSSQFDKFQGEHVLFVRHNNLKPGAEVNLWIFLGVNYIAHLKQ